MSAIKDMFGGGQKPTNNTQKVDLTTTGKQTTTPFSSQQSQERFNNFYDAAKDNYTNTLQNQNNLNNKLDQYAKNGIGDTSYFKQAWGQAQGINQDNINKMTTMSWNPNDNSDWVKANDDIDKNARLGWGQYNNQLMQNMVKNNMANGSGHQTAAARQSMMLNSQLAADRANRWQQQYNQNMQNNLAANGQLENFYSTLSNIGIDYARLNQQDLSTLLNAYNQTNNMQDSALRMWGNAVQMGADPTQEREGTEKGTTAASVGQRDGSWGQAIGNIAGMFAGYQGWL